MSEFHNPYNFVPAPPRDKLDHKPPLTEPRSPSNGDAQPGGLGDEPPVGHDRYHADRYSGTIRVKLTTETPLLIPDAARATDDANGHKTYPVRTVRIDDVDYPYLPPTSVKGMLRSAFEAVTNSRMGVFSGHGDPITFRKWFRRKRKSRRVNYSVAPQQLLSQALLPAEAREALSPADRVFGWANQDGRGAYRANLRVGRVRCNESFDRAVIRFTPPLPLAILGAPKPQQGRFYVAKNQLGDAQRDGLSKEQAGYQRRDTETGEDKGLRGRKVYPHHANLPADYWTVPLDRTTDATLVQVPKSGHFREYLRPGGVCDNQNRSIKGWIKPGVTFNFDLHVTNLSAVELGALVWLLTLPAGHFHRLGGGKPLGFGSVRLEIDETATRVANGEAWKNWYESLVAQPPARIQLQAAKLEFETATQAAANQIYQPRQFGGFGEVPYIAAFLQACRGFDQLPTHYPRARQRDQNKQPIPGPVPPHPDGKAYEWFVSNDRREHRYSLGDLAGDQGLPILDAPN